MGKTRVSESASQQVSEPVNRQDGARALPDGWVWTTIGGACKVNPRMIRPEQFDDDTKVSFVPMAAVDGVSGVIVGPQARPIGEVWRGYKRFAEGDVIFAKITPCMENGKAAIARGLLNGIGLGSTEFHVLRPLGGILPQWIYHFVRQESFRREAAAKMSGTAGQLRVPTTFMQEAAIPLAPLSEQRHIVAEIETQFTRLDAGVAALERVQANLRRYKAAVLKAACEGRLVPAEAELARAEGRDYEPADQLLARVMAARRSRWETEHPGKRYKEPTLPDAEGLPVLPEEWVWVTLDQLTCHITSGSRGWATYYSDQGSTFIRAQDIKTDELVLENVAHVDLPESAEGTRTRVFLNDLLVTITGANVTRTALVRRHLDDAYVSQHVGLVRPVRGDISQYLYYWIVAPTHGRRMLEKAAYGAGKPGLNLANLRELPIGVPPLPEQRRIVAEVERRLSVVEALERAVEVALARAGRLRQAVLKQAFEGRLVAQDPDDEPAAVLLERIRATREAQATDGKKRKTRQMRLPEM